MYHESDIYIYMYIYIFMYAYIYIYYYTFLSEGCRNQTFWLGTDTTLSDHRSVVLASIVEQLLMAQESLAQCRIVQHLHKFRQLEIGPIAKA